MIGWFSTVLFAAGLGRTEGIARWENGTRHGMALVKLLYNGEALPLDLNLDAPGVLKGHSLAQWPGIRQVKHMSALGMPKGFGQRRGMTKKRKDEKEICKILVKANRVFQGAVYNSTM